MDPDDIFAGIITALTSDSTTDNYKIYGEFKGGGILESHYRTGVIEVQRDPKGFVEEEEHQAAGTTRVRYNYLARISRKNADRAEAIKLVEQMVQEFKTALRAGCTHFGLQSHNLNFLRFGPPLIVQVKDEEVTAPNGAVSALMPFYRKGYQDAD